MNAFNIKLHKTLIKLYKHYVCLENPIENCVKLIQT